MEILYSPVDARLNATLPPSVKKCSSPLQQFYSHTQIHMALSLMLSAICLLIFLFFFFFSFTPPPTYILNLLNELLIKLKIWKNLFRMSFNLIIIKKMLEHLPGARCSLVNWDGTERSRRQFLHLEFRV